MTQQPATPEPTTLATVANTPLPNPAEQYDLATTPPAAAQPPAARHSQGKISIALDLGLTQAEIEASTPEELDRTVYQLYRQRQQIQQEMLRTRGFEAALSPPPAAVPVTPQPADEYDFSFPEESILEPAVLDTLKKIGGSVKTLAKRNKELEEKLVSYERAEAGRRQESLAETLDRIFDGLDAKHPGMFGKGRGSAMQPGSHELLRRIAVVNMIDRLQGSLEERVSQAAAIVAGPPAQQPPPRPVPPKNPADGRFITPELERWNNATLNRPTQRAGSTEPTGVEKATQSVAAYLRDAGQEQGDNALKDEFLD